MLNIRCFLSCVQIFEHFLNTLRPHFCVALCHLAVGAKIALKRGKKNCKPLFRDLHFLCELFRSRIIKFYVIWLKNVVFRLFAHSFRPRPPFNPIFSFSLKTHIRYILSYDGYVRIYTADRMYRRETSLEKMLELLDERLFVRIDRGTVVNMAYVEKEEGDAFVLEGQKFRIARRRREEVRRAYIDFKLKYRGRMGVWQ